MPLPSVVSWYDSWHDPVDLEQWRHRCQLAPHREIAAVSDSGLYAEGYWSEQTLEAWIGGVLQAVQRSGRPILGVLKLHPLDNVDSSRQLVEKLGFAETRVLSDFDPRIIIELSSLVIALNSTVGHEALLLDRPIFVASLVPGPFVPVLGTTGAVDDGAALIFEDSPSLAAGIACFFDDQTMRHDMHYARQAYRARFQTLIDGHASQRVAEFILEIAGNGVVPSYGEP